MAEMTVKQQVTKEEARDAIFETLNRFKKLILSINDKSKSVKGSELDRLASQMADNNFISVMTKISHWDLKDLDSEGHSQILSICGQLSEKYSLGITVPENVEVIGNDEIWNEFLNELAKHTLDVLRKNREELKNASALLLEQAENINFYDSNKTYIEDILLAKKTFNQAKTKNEEAHNEICRLAVSHELDGYDPWYEQQRKSASEMEQILLEYPLVQFFDGNTEKKKVCNQINSLVNKITKSLNSIEEKILKCTYPIWELTPLVTELLAYEKFSKNKDIIIEAIEKLKDEKYRKELIITIGSVVLTVAGLLIPGGCSLGLLIAKGITTSAGAGLGIKQSYDDWVTSSMIKDTAYASLRLTEEQIALVENADVSQATKDYILSGVFLGLSILDIKDTVKSFKLIKKLDKIDAVTREALKQSKRFGEKAFENIDNLKLNAIGQHARATKVFDNIATLTKEEIPVALDFFPGKFNANVIWLGSDGVEAKKVLTSGRKVRTQYNDIVKTLNSELDLLIDFSKPAEELEGNLNKIIPEIVRKQKISLADESEHIALLKESLPPSELEKTRIYMRVQTNNGWSTVADSRKEFAWVTDPLMVNFKQGIPNELMDAVGFTKDYAKNYKNKVYADFIIFKDQKTAQRFVNSSEIIGWDKIFNDFYKKFDDEIGKAHKKAFNSKAPNPFDFDNLKDIYGDLITEDGKFNRKLFEEKYYKYFTEEHMFGTKYTGKMEELLGDKIDKTTGATYLFEGGGVTVEENGGLRSIERPLYKDTDEIDFSYDANKMNETDYMRVFRFEVTSDTSKPIQIVKIGADGSK